MKLIKRILAKIGFKLIRFGYPTSLVILSTSWDQERCKKFLHER